MPVPGEEEESPFITFEGEKHSLLPKAARSPPLRTAAGEAEMILSIEMGKLRHSGWRGLSVGTDSSPCHCLPPAWPGPRSRYL